MPTNLPGGRLIAGMGGNINVISPFDGSMTRLDVARWERERKVKQWRKGHSGSLGAILTRTVALDWTVRARVWWDIGNDPETLLFGLPGSWGCGLQLGLGTKVAQVALGARQQQFMLCPSGMLETLTVVNSSEGNEEDGIVYADAVINGNSLMFLLPQQLDFYNNYVQQLQALGQFTGLNTFTTMQ